MTELFDLELPLRVFCVGTESVGIFQFFRDQVAAYLVVKSETKSLKQKEKNKNKFQQKGGITNGSKEYDSNNAEQPAICKGNLPESIPE